MVMKVRQLLILLCAMLLPLSEAVSRDRPVIAGFNGFPMSVQGLEKWDVEGRTYKITHSYYLAADNKVEYAVELPLGVEKSIKTLTYEEALAFTKPVIKHAFQTKAYQRKKFKSIGSLPAVQTHAITAIIYQHDGVTSRVFRISLPIDDLATYNQAKSAQSDEELRAQLAGSWTVDSALEKDVEPHLSHYKADGTMTSNTYSDKTCTKTVRESVGTWTIEDGYLNIIVTKSSDENYNIGNLITDQIVKIDDTSMQLIAVDSVSKEPILNPFNSPKQFRKRSDRCY